MRNTYADIYYGYIFMLSAGDVQLWERRKEWFGFYSGLGLCQTKPSFTLPNPSSFESESSFQHTPGWHLPPVPHSWTSFSLFSWYFLPLKSISDKVLDMDCCGLFGNFRHSKVLDFVPGCMVQLQLIDWYLDAQHWDTGLIIRQYQCSIMCDW